jgi:hypothetical protein
MSILLLAPIVSAQETAKKQTDHPSGVDKGLENISKQSIEAALSFLASDALEGREAGKNGGLVAAEYIKSVLKEQGIKPFYDSYFQVFEAYSPVREKGVEFQVDPDSIAKYKSERAFRKLNLQNVVGYIEGQKKEEYIVIGAHYDHVGIDELLVGDQIYNGADDNASSVAAVLQVAKAVVTSGEKPLRTIIFAFWDGEEVNYLGSEYFVANFKSLQAIKAYINLDMVGREGGVLPIFHPKFRVPENARQPLRKENKWTHILYSEKLEKVKGLLLEDIEKYRLNITPKLNVIPPKSHGSDNLSFSLRDIPEVWFFTGLHPDYHTPWDEVETINFDNLTNITKATYLVLWDLANE